MFTRPFSFPAPTQKKEMGLATRDYTIFGQIQNLIRPHYYATRITTTSYLREQNAQLESENNQQSRGGRSPNPNW